ncbi:class I adenylate-forming enzyme family protein [Pseudohongiella spirulinae]|uniref:AMP-dependent synthetase and ligase n=1 Tax=Pseudohongiella spirulinae TaxID=1249552 RepID=A0A0S2KCI3_9GAMM|nr:class I adenylate-forming enzyme family protein [Pseudohongiella spirulinae]ALO45695.1 AMP-dependent synthetase and ligase [Pseudohongiella spirulinae]
MQSNDEQLLGQSPQQLIASLPARVSSALFEQAQRRPEAAAVSDHLGRGLNYQQLAAVVQQTAEKLTTQGVCRGDRVLLINENCVPVLVLILALSELGAWPVVVNARMAAAEIDRIRSHCQPRLALYLMDSQAAAAQWQTLQSASVGSDCMLNVVGGEVACRTYETQRLPQDQQLSDQGVFTLIYTTGTTGDPKGVMLTHRNVLYVAAVSGALRGLSADDRVYLVLPVSHIFGLSAVFLASIYAGAELIVADRFDPAQAMQTMRERQVSGIFGVPAMFARLADHARSTGISGADLPALRFMYSGGAPLDPAIKLKTEKLFSLPLLNGYGMTESGPTICQVRYNEPLDNCSVGRPLPGMEIRLLGPDGKPVADGEVGELHIRGPNIMLGYYHNPQATAAVLDADGFLNTGDLVKLDERGNVHIAGRSKELIIHSGFNVYPPEVEGVISAHPQVLLCAVIGREAEGNEMVVAYVQLAGGSDLDEETLQTWLKPRLTAYKRPSQIIFMDPLPTAPSGKVLKHKLQSAAR